MIKLQKIINGLENESYSAFVEVLQKTKADNFLFLMEAYKSGTADDQAVMGKLNISKNSFYVLKSRLHEKIQHFLTGDVVEKSEDLLKQISLVNDKCFNTPRAIAESFLLKLEKDLLLYDMHYELQIVYAALKRLHLFSDKYFHYSQLYNKQIALGISHDKCEELLGEFNRILGHYNFSRFSDSIVQLNFLKNEVVNHHQLNPSRQIVLIRNIIDLQLDIFCNVKQGTSSNIQHLFENSRQILSELPDSSPYKSRELILDHLCFEYYLKLGDLHTASTYYEKVNNDSQNLLLHNSISNTSRFITSKIKFLQLTGRIEDLNEDATYSNNDPYDMHTNVLLGIHNAMKCYYAGDLKQGVKFLIDLININSFKDLFHINLEIKLTLTYFYIKLKDHERALLFLNSIQRKIKTEKLEKYTNALNLIKIFIDEINSNEKTISGKQKDLFTIFIARNNDENNIIIHLVNELKTRYN